MKPLRLIAFTDGVGAMLSRNQEIPPISTNGTGTNFAEFDSEREAIAVVVSASNDCAYCVNHHVEALRRYLKDEETLSLLSNADGLETLEPRLSNIVRHAEKLTTAPGAMTESDLGELRAVGLSDQDILDVSLITAYFNFVNRIALGLGVVYSDEEVSGYHNEEVAGDSDDS